MLQINYNDKMNRFAAESNLTIEGLAAGRRRCLGVSVSQH